MSGINRSPGRKPSSGSSVLIGDDRFSRSTAPFCVSGRRRPRHGTDIGRQPLGVGPEQIDEPRAGLIVSTRSRMGWYSASSGPKIRSGFSTAVDFRHQFAEQPREGLQQAREVHRGQRILEGFGRPPAAVARAVRDRTGSARTAARPRAYPSCCSTVPGRPLSVHPQPASSHRRPGPARPKNPPGSARRSAVH